MHVYGAGIAVIIKAPHFVEELVACEDAVRVRGEMIDELHFLRRSVNLDALDLEFIICKVDGEILIVNFFHLRGFFFANAAKDGVDTRDDFFCLERLYDVIVRAEL